MHLGGDIRNLTILLLLTFGLSQNYSLYFDGDWDGVEIIFPDVNVEDFIKEFSSSLWHQESLYHRQYISSCNGDGT